MYKDLPGGEAVRRWKPILIRHGQFKARVYARIGEGRPHLGAMLPPSKRQARGGGGPSTSAAGHTVSEFSDHPTASR